MKAQSSFSIRVMLVLALIFGSFLFLTLNATGQHRPTKPTARKTAKKAAPAPKKAPAVPRPSPARMSVASVSVPVTATATAQAQYRPRANPFGAFTESLRVRTASPTSPLITLLNQLSTDTTSKKRGTIGGSLTIFLKGHVLAGVTVKKPLYYYSLGGGMYFNPYTLKTSPDLVLYGGAGFSPQSRVFVGGIITLSLLSVPAYKTVGTQIELVNTKKPSLDVGVQGSFELKKHVWVSATVHRQFGIGVGGTYFF